jgi:O-antigen/teichoic acid export membrane protein
MRTRNSVKNISVAIFGQIFGILITFIARIVFVKTLPTEYLGINGLFTNILSILSLADLGISSAIVFSLYKPLADKDETKIKALMRFYSKAYKIVGVIVLLLGLLIYPFLDFIIKDKQEINNIGIFYLLFLANSVISYFYAYKRTIIIADQKNYIATIYRYSCFFILNIVQIILLLLTKNFLFFLLAQITFTLVENVLVSKRADKLYPFIKNNHEKLDKETKGVILKNIWALSYHRVGGILVSSTDNIIISSMVGLYYVGLYSNYILITMAVSMVIGQIFASLASSVGNLNAVESKAKSFSIFNTIQFVNFWMLYFSSICLIVLLNPFISIWIGREYLLDFSTVLFIVINFFVTGMRKTVLIFKDSFGLFWHDRYKSIIEAIINLIASLILAKQFGMVGVLIGTFISTMTTCFWVEPYVLYKHGFNKRIKEYFINYSINIIIATTVGVLTYITSQYFFNEYNLVNFIGKLAICIIIPNVIFILLYYRNNEFKTILKIGKNILCSFLKKVTISN